MSWKRISSKRKTKIFLSTKTAPLEGGSFKKIKFVNLQAGHLPVGLDFEFSESPAHFVPHNVTLRQADFPSLYTEIENLHYQLQNIISLS